MRVAQPSAPDRARRRGLLLAAAVALAAGAVTGCRFMPSGGHWIEAHGHGQGSRLAAWPAGVTLIGTDARLHQYPTDWARPWRAQGPQEVKALAASSSALYALTPAGEVARIVNGQWAPVAGSVTWGATNLGASPDDHLFVVVGGHLRRVDAGELRDAPCGNLAVSAVSPVGNDEVYVVDGTGGLYRGVGGSCAPVPTPGPVRDVASFGGRQVAVTSDGAVWRRRGDAAWRALPPVIKYRSARDPFEVPAVQVSLSAFSTWALDQEGSIFLLSDETEAAP
jgi:hypothetical protein